MKTFITRIYLVVGICLGCFGNYINAQVIEISLASGAPDVTGVVNYRIGSPITASLHLMDTTGDVIWQLGTISGDFIGSSGLEMNLNGTVFASGMRTIPSGTSPDISFVLATGVTPITDEYVIELEVSDNDSGNVEVEITVIVSRPPIDVMLVLDRSGSMNILDGPGRMSRWDVLKSGVNNFVTNFRLHGAVGDRLGLIYFDDTRLDLAGGDLRLFANLAQPTPAGGVSGSDVSTHMNATGPSGWTCLGGGILAANAEFSSSSTNLRHMIVFSDGLQNREPSFDLSTFNISDRNIHPDGTGFPTGSLNLSTNTVKIFTISIGDGAFNDIMSGIANAPTDSHYDGMAYPLNHMDMLVFPFTDVFINQLRAFSPSYVDIKNVGIKDPEGQSYRGNTQFLVNKSANSVMIDLVAAPDILRPIEWNIVKDGKDLSSFVVAVDPLFRKFFISKKDAERLGVSMAGNWQVNLRRFANDTASVQLSCIVNDEQLRFNPQVTSGEPGDFIEIATNITFKGKPTNNTKVVAYVFKPGEDINTLFADAATPSVPNGFPIEPRVNPGQIKYDLLIQDPSIINRLKTQGQEISLGDRGNGNYAVRFTNTNESGVYQIVIKVTGTSLDSSSFERLAVFRQVIDFGPASASKTQKKLSVDANKNFTLDLTPLNKFGYKLGTNRLDQIKIRVDNQQLQLIDNLNGSYSVSIPSSITQISSNPEILVQIKGKTFFDGKLNDFINPTGGRIPFGLGLTIPTGNFANTYKGATYLELKGLFKLQSRLFINLEGGLFNFTQKTTNDKFKIYDVSGGLHYDFARFGAGRWNFYIDGNGGYYKPDNIKGSFGYNGGLGLTYSAGNIFGEIGSSFHQVTGSSTMSFWGIGFALGVKL